MFDSTATNNHISSLIKCCSQCYAHIRLNHLAKRKTETLAGKKVRKQLSKLIQYVNPLIEIGIKIEIELHRVISGKVRARLASKSHQWIVT